MKGLSVVLDIEYRSRYYQTIALSGSLVAISVQPSIIGNLIITCKLYLVFFKYSSQKIQKLKVSIVAPTKIEGS